MSVVGNELTQRASNEHRWGLILAGGEGTRLRSLTTLRSGTAVPKQFCSLTGGRTLLEDAIARAEGVIPRPQVCSMVTAHHRQWWEPVFSRREAGHTIVQPQGRGTGIGILYGVLHIVARDPHAQILLLPADHHVGNELLLRQSLHTAFTRLEQGMTSTLLLGLEPDGVDTELGYILPGQRDQLGTSAVTSFVEKPATEVACRIIAEGALWNTFIVAVQGSVLIDLFRERHGDLVEQLQTYVCRAMEDGETDEVSRALENLYEGLPVSDFSRDLLAHCSAALRVIRVPACGWSDLGTPSRVAQTLRCLSPAQAAYSDAPEFFPNLAVQYARLEQRSAMAR